MQQRHPLPCAALVAVRILVQQQAPINHTHCRVRPLWPSASSFSNKPPINHTHCRVRPLVAVRWAACTYGTCGNGQFDNLTICKLEKLGTSLLIRLVVTMPTSLTCMFRFRYLLLFILLQCLQSICKLSGVVFPPSLQGLMWSPSISSYSKCFPHFRQIPFCCS